LRKFPKAEIDQRVKEAARILDIEHLLERKPKALSGGQRQRVALGRAIVRNAKVFLMDEPLSNLDAKLRVQMRAEISKLHKKLETTVIYVTHDQTEAMTMGDRIVVMKLGEVQQADTPETLYTNPINMFVAGFIGSPAMNFINGKIVEKAGDLVFVADNMEIALPENRKALIREKQYVGKDVVFGIRPEDIHEDASFLETYAKSTISVNVDVAENLGSEMYLYLEGVGKDTIIARISGRSGIKENQNVTLAFDMSKFHLFDKDTEAAIFFEANPAPVAEKGKI
jgi:multiple sugar transport system ATP-binding protein